MRKSICVLTLLICIVHLFALDNLASALNMNVQCYKAGPTPGYNCKNWSGRVTMTFVFYQPATYEEGSWWYHPEITYSFQSPTGYAGCPIDTQFGAPSQWYFSCGAACVSQSGFCYTSIYKLVGTNPDEWSLQNSAVSCGTTPEVHRPGKLQSPGGYLAAAQIWTASKGKVNPGDVCECCCQNYCEAVYRFTLIL